MRCSKAEKLIIQRLDGGGGAGTGLERHIESCPKCGKYHEEVSNLIQSLRSAPEPQKSEAFWDSFPESVRRRIRQAETTRAYRPAIPARRSPLLRPALALVPAAIILAVAASFIFTRPRQPAAPAGGYDALISMFAEDSILNLPASDAVVETSGHNPEYYENVELPGGVFGGRSGLLQGATPAEIVDEISESDLKAIYESLAET